MQKIGPIKNQTLLQNSFLRFFAPKITIFVIVTSPYGARTSVGADLRLFYSFCKNFFLDISIGVDLRAALLRRSFFGGFSQFSHFLAYKCRIPIFDPFAYF